MGQGAPGSVPFSSLSHQRSRFRISKREGRPQKMLREIDALGIMATPANSSYNELVIEAGRQSILNGGREVTIKYE